MNNDAMDPKREFELSMTRRQLFGKAALGVGTAALHRLLLGSGLMAPIAALAGQDTRHGGLTGIPHFAPKAKRVIYLFMNGGPRSSICGTTSPSSTRNTTPTSPSASAWASDSPP